MQLNLQNMNKTLYFNLEDDIKKIAEKIRHEKVADLVLVFPKKSYLFSDGVNLKLLKKQTDLLSKEVYILTMDERGQTYAKEAGFGLKFLPKTEEDLKRENLCPNGLQPFTVLQAADQTSTTGKEMIALKLNVHAEDGDYHLYDYISPYFMPFKLRHFAVSVGLESKYNAGSLCAADCENREGWCDVAQKDDKQYGPKNVIKDYTVGAKVSAPAPSAKPAPTTAPPAEDDDVPF